MIDAMLIAIPTKRLGRRDDVRPPEVVAKTRQEYADECVEVLSHWVKANISTSHKPAWRGRRT